MANKDAPGGLTPVGTKSGGSWTAKVKIYNADASRTAANDAGSIAVGDPVKLETDGNVTVAAAGESSFGTAVGVTSFPAQTDGFGSGTTPHGDINLQRTYLPATTAGEVMVAVGSDVLYEIQEDGLVSQLALINVGNNVDLIAPTTHIDTSNGQSLYEIDSDTVGTATAQYRIWDIVDAPDNAVGSTGCRWIVYINEDQFNSTTGI